MCAVIMKEIRKHNSYSSTCLFSNCLIKRGAVLEMINLDNDEVVLLQADDVLLHSGDKSGKGLLAPSAHAGTLTLTNKKLCFTYSTGVIKKTEELIEIDLNQIKVFEGVAQLKPAVLKERVGYVSLIAYLPNDEYEFDFPQREKKKLLEFANMANKAITGVGDYWSIENVGGKSIAKTLRGAIGAAAPVVSDLADAAKPLVPLAGEVMNAKSSTTSGIFGVVTDVIAKGIGGRDGTSDETNAAPALESQTDSQSLTLDEQIDAVQKVKELYDAGILSEEEFLVKKKQIMGL